MSEFETFQEWKQRRARYEQLWNETRGRCEMNEQRSTYFTERNAQNAVEWILAGRLVQERKAGSDDPWMQRGPNRFDIDVRNEYRLAPPKPDEAYMFEYRRAHDEPWVYFSTLINPSDRSISRVVNDLYHHSSGRQGSKDSGNVRVRKFVEVEMP